ncbi:hypothetical protein [Mycolicibacterium sp. PDY-3]|uniref:hypothetical protein n=1 Tax=Mycolicibacterium sp. PDY-3 TaxID=3376069 RepID=UPI003792C7FF
MAIYDVTGRVVHNGSTYEVGESFESDDQKVVDALKEAGVLGRKLADKTVEAEVVTTTPQKVAESKTDKKSK